MLGADDLGELFVWINGSHAIHENMCGHTGQLVAKSSKKKTKTQSSTETEVVAMSKFIPYPLHMKNILEVQEYLLQILLYQDNQCAIR